MTRQAFEYAVLRAVPRVDRGEFVNIGVLLYCQASDFLAARSHVDPDRLRAVDAAVDVEAVEGAADAVAAVCAGQAGEDPVVGEPAGARFRWLTAPRSTVVQPGPVHAGLTEDPEAELERLFRWLVL